jgi:4-aminobutyrate aminotransferase-like enzyme
MEPDMLNAEVARRRDDAISRGVGMMTQIYADRALNSEVWDIEGNRYIDFAAGIAVVNTGHCHPKVMAHGLNLTEADTLVFYAPIYSNDEYQQVTERFNRAGQTRKMTVVRIAAHPIEWKIYGVVDGKKTTQDNILNLYNSITA